MAFQETASPAGGPRRPPARAARHRAPTRHRRTGPTPLRRRFDPTTLRRRFGLTALRRGFDPTALRRGSGRAHRPGRHRGPGGRLASAASIVVAALLVWTAAAIAPTARPDRPAAPPRAVRGGPAWGAFLGSGPEGVARLSALRDWSGHDAALRVGRSYLPGGNWSDIRGEVTLLPAWARWRRAAADRLFVLNVPMLPRNEERVPDDTVRTLLTAGADGAHDAHFRALAERLVALGVPDTVLVLGWEMNGTTYTGRCAPDPEAWKAYWRRIVTRMRAVPGQRFQFDFAPSRGRDAIPWPDCYPGDDVVDIVGMDSYDQPPGDTFAEQVEQPYGLRDQVEFAARHGKPHSYPEWGLFRHGDNPAYMRGMLDWFARHPPLYQSITDYCPHGVWRCRRNPEAARVFRDRTTGAEPPGGKPAREGAAGPARPGAGPPRTGSTATAPEGAAPPPAAGREARPPRGTGAPTGPRSGAAPSPGLGGPAAAAD
nr:glycosyl hydrolase [Streptomyces sp. SAJ15]